MYFGAFMASQFSRCCVAFAQPYARNQSKTIFSNKSKLQNKILLIDSHLHLPQTIFKLTFISQEHLVMNQMFPKLVMYFPLPFVQFYKISNNAKSQSDRSHTLSILATIVLVLLGRLEKIVKYCFFL